MLRIEAIPVTGGQAFVIASGSGLRGDGAKEVADNIEVTYDAIVPRAQYLDGKAQVFIGNATGGYNQTGYMPLTVDYQFANSQAGIAACFRFWSLLQYTVPVLANIIIGPAGARVIIPNVNLRPLRVRTEGEVAVRVTYPIAFGRITP